MRIAIVLIILILKIFNCGSIESNDQLIKNLARSDDSRIMVLVTLSGSMIAIDPQSANLRWIQQHDPIVKTNGQESLNISSFFLPDPVSGQLYSMKSTNNDEFELSRFDYTIPDLALKSPFLSKDKVLYTGRKMDSWFIINSLTGECKTVMDFDDPKTKTTDLIPFPNIHDVYIGRTQYDVCMTNMHQANNSREIWNVSMYQYNAFEMNNEIYDKYEFIHIVSSSSGKMLTLLKSSGQVLWHKNDFNSPVVALFLMGRNGFLNIPFTTVDDNVFEKLLEPLNYEKFKNIDLLETIFIGENKSAGSNSFYALPTYTDSTTFIIRDKIVNFLKDPSSIIGHHFLQSENNKIPLITDEKVDKSDDLVVKKINFEYISAIIILIIIGIATIVVTLSFKRKIKEEFSSTKSNKSDVRVLNPTIEDDGTVKISKISFNPTNILGKGCEGTFVYSGKYEGRNVAVKRLLIDCFTLANREVKALQESDNHENIIRYFCTEFDRQFCYIAIELCACSLHDYVMSEKFENFKDLIKPKEVLSQATRGLSHLHQLNIIHRDIKPQNILITSPDSRGNVKALISDFGLCKRIDKGNVSVTNRAGTEGWIASELMRNESISKTCDIFSLGCVFYFTLTNGNHPFGDSLMRQSNILMKKFNLGELKSDNCEDILASELITDMINDNPHTRPVSDVILRHPLFWSEGKMLDFLQSVSDRVEKLNTNEEPLWSLERNAKMIVKGDWKTVIDEEILNDLGKQRTYHGISVRDLLRAVRNKRNHYMELSDEVKNILGSIPVDYANYWLNKFPHLFSHIYHVMQICSKESSLSRFYVRYFSFSKPEYLSNNSLDNHELIELQMKCKMENYKNYKYNNVNGSPRGRNNSYDFNARNRWSTDNEKNGETNQESKFNGNFNQNKNKNRGKRGYYNFKIAQ